MSDQPFRVLGKTIVEASRAYDPDKPTGRLGYAIAGVNYIIDPKDSNRFLVRLDRAGTFVSAYHRGRVTPEWDLAVDLVKIRKGNREYYEITGTNIDEHPPQGGQYGGLLHVGPHHHLRGTDMEIALDPRQILRLKPTISTGLIVTVTAGFYWFNGMLHWFEGGTLDLTDGVPDTASQHRWGIIALDLLTQTLALLAGDSRVILQPLTSADLPDIDLMSQLPLAAVKLRYGMTRVQELDFEDLRFIFGTDGVTSLVLRDAVDKTISSGVITVGEGETILRVAPETGSADTLSQIDISGKPRVLFLLPADGATITVQHYIDDPDNIYFYNEADLDLSAQQTLMMLWDGTLIRAVGTGASSLTVNNAATGVNLALTGDELSAALNIDGLTEETAPSGTDFVAVESGAGLRKVALENLPGSAPGGGSVLYRIQLQNRQTSGTDGGTATSGAWQTCVLNTEVVDQDNNCTLSSNQFTLDAGTYWLEASHQFYETKWSQLRIQNISDSTTAILGENEYLTTGRDHAGHAVVSGLIVIAASKTFELQYRVSDTRATSGLGLAAGWGDEIYATVNLVRQA